jgi:hypothetical protein
VMLAIRARFATLGVEPTTTMNDRPCGRVRA